VTNIREYIDTQALARASETAASPSSNAGTPTPHGTIRKVSEYESLIPRGKMGRPEEIARVARAALPDSYGAASIISNLMGLLSA